MQKELGQYPAILSEQAWSITYMFWNWPPDEGFIKGFKVVVSVKKKKKKIQECWWDKTKKIPYKNHLKIKRTCNYYFRTISYCSRTKVKTPLTCILRTFYATWPMSSTVKARGRLGYQITSKILNPNQFACMAGWSTLSQLPSCYNDWTKSHDNRKPTDIAFLHFSKAFDSVLHEGLLFKLGHQGIEPLSAQLLRCYCTLQLSKCFNREMISIIINSPVEWEPFFLVKGPINSKSYH